MVKTISALIRFALVMAVIVIGTPLVVITSPLPIHYDGSRLCAWIITFASRLILFFARIDVEPFDRSLIRHHHGFVFVNHQSYIEVLILFSIRRVSRPRQS